MVKKCDILRISQRPRGIRESKNITKQPLSIGKKYSSHQKPVNVHADRGTEEPVGEEQLVVGVAGLCGDAEVEEADPGFQLAGEVQGLCS